MKGEKIKKKGKNIIHFKVDNWLSNLGLIISISFGDDLIKYELLLPIEFSNSNLFSVTFWYSFSILKFNILYFNYIIWTSHTLFKLLNFFL